MRRPPRDCERLRSPDMLRGRSQCQWPAVRRGGWRTGGRTGEGYGGAWGGGCRKRLYSERGRCREEEVLLLYCSSELGGGQLWRRRRRGGRREVDCVCGMSGAGGCNAMQSVCVGVACMAVYIRVDRRAQCDVVLTSMLLAGCCTRLLSLPTHQVRFLPCSALTACTKSTQTLPRCRSQTLNRDTFHLPPRSPT